MANEMKLLYAFIEAQGFEIEEVKDYQPRKEFLLRPSDFYKLEENKQRVLTTLSYGTCQINQDGSYNSTLINPIIDYKLHRVATPTEEELTDTVPIEEWKYSKSYNVGDRVLHMGDTFRCAVEVHHGLVPQDGNDSGWFQVYYPDRVTNSHPFINGLTTEDFLPKIRQGMKEDKTAEVASELLPCPFCGKTDTLNIRYTSPGFEVVCLCGALINNSSNEVEAAELWNKRA